MTPRPPRVLALVCAHPDDDVMGAAGLIALRRDDPGLRFVLVIATDGELGAIAPGSGATRETLGAVRRAEDVAGWDAVGRRPERHEFLGFADGSLDSLPPGRLERAIEDVLVEERPDVVLTFGPDGITGHPDHIAVGAATDAVFLRLVGTPGPGFRRLLHGVYPEAPYQRMQERRQESGREPWDPGAVYHPRSAADPIAVTVDQGQVWSVVRDAFRAHRSQWAPPWSESGDREWRSSAGAAHYSQAWPARDPGDPVLADVFEGLTDPTA